MNGIIIVDKTEGWTSQDVCSKLRGVLHEKRIGHGGTLDPMATGVLPVFCGRATRAVEFCENAEKRYTAGFRPGITTDTQDTTGTVLKSTDATVTESGLLNVLPRFLGPQEQIPPMYSAVKIGGKKLYELARRGETVERKPRPITISSISLLGKDENGDFLLDVICSKGTYIRTLLNDIGDALGCGGAMSSLRRTAAGSFTIADAVPLDEVISAASSGSLEGILRPVDSLFSEHPALTIDGEELRRCKNGNDFPAALSDGAYRVYDTDGKFLMLGRCEDGRMKTVKSFFEV